MNTESKTVTYLKELAFHIVSKYTRRVTLIEGVLKGTDHPLRCLFVGNTYFMEYITARTFQNSPVVIKSKRIWVPKVRKLIESNTDGIDIVMAEFPYKYESYFQDYYDFRSQGLVRQVLDVSGSMDDSKGRFHKKLKSTFRKLRRSGLEYRISRDKSDFELFYNRMYLPHIRQKFGDLANVNSPEKMEKYFQRGFLILVTDHNRPISGGICWTAEKSLICKDVGVLDGNPDFTKKGAQSAVDYYLVDYAKKNNIERIDMGISLPFLNDGVYTSKKEWGAKVCPYDGNKSWEYFFILRHSKHIVRFFEINPVIIGTHEGLGGVVGWMGGKDLTKEEEDNLRKEFYSPGLENLFVMTPDSKDMMKISFQNRPS